MKILCLDIAGLHLGYLGCYGNEWIATPTLDRLAAEGVVFDQHYADSLGVSRSPWTGRYDLPASDLSFRETINLLPALLREYGITVALVEPPASAPASAEEGTALERTLEEILAALDRLSAEPTWLLWADLPPLLPPWDIPEDFRDRYFQEEQESEPDAAEEEPLTPLLDPAPAVVDREDYLLVDRLQNTYAAAVSYLDTALALLVEELRERQLLDELMLIVTAERGLALAEHGIVGDWRPWLHDELIHLPLIVRLPGGAEAGQRVSALTQPVDLFPTLLGAFGLSVPEAHGHALQPLMTVQSEAVRQYACAGLRLGETFEWALRTSEWGFLLPGPQPPEEPPREPRLYVKPDDRWEVNDVHHHHLDLVEHLEQTLRGFVAATRQLGPLRPPVLGEFEGSGAEAP